MTMDTYSLARAGLSEDEILAIANNKDEKEQMRMLRKYRFRLLDDIHSKQQSLDTICCPVSRLASAMLPLSRTAATIGIRTTQAKAAGRFCSVLVDVAGIRNGAKSRGSCIPAM